MEYKIVEHESLLEINKYSKLVTWNWNSCLKYACVYKRADVIKMCLFKGADKEYGYILASRYGNREIVDIFIKCGMSNWNDGLYNACLGGNMQVVEIMIGKGADDWNHGLSGACECGDIQIVNLMIEKGANNWNDGLHSACYGCNIDIVNIMIDKGCNDLDGGIRTVLGSVSVYDEHKRSIQVSIIRLLMDKGANNWVSELRLCSYRARRDLVDLYLEYHKHEYNKRWLFDDACQHRWIDLIFKCTKKYTYCYNDYDICELFREPFEYRVVNVCVKMFDRNLFKSSKSKSNKRKRKYV
jgi:hypothetical protein